ncbi:MAG: FimB/Mfa2 family fimbrial subunit, partial [Muribaculaceae bacterium]|nr:FimB/Mfa2 family fimbrial subunit [Muribaculaceae bacterium]
PLERTLLLYKAQFHASMADDEYLDREDDYNITFILDKNNNWNRAAMIYINNWATLPVQYQEW